MRSIFIAVWLILVLCCLSREVRGWNTTAVADFDVMQLRKSSSQDQGDLPASLQHIFVCITFHWEVGSLNFLRQALAPLERYPTKVAIRVLTNQPQRLRLAMQSWSSQALVCSPEAALSHRYQLAFAHRTYMEEALKSTDPEYTAFIYLESDIRLPWRALLGWAADEPVLSRLGFQRAFYRVEPIEQNGLLGLTDQMERVQLATYPRTVRTRAMLGEEIVQEKYFLQLPNPYMGMWIADRDRLVNFTTSLQWTKEIDPWDTREMAACGLQFIGTPDGFVSSAVVPYDPESGQLDADSAVEHLSNKYCGAHTRDGMTLDVNKVDNPTARHCRISVESFLV